MVESEHALETEREERIVAARIALIMQQKGLQDSLAQKRKNFDHAKIVFEVAEKELVAEEEQYEKNLDEIHQQRLAIDRGELPDGDTSADFTTEKVAQSSSVSDRDDQRDGIAAHVLPHDAIQYDLLACIKAIQSKAPYYFLPSAPSVVLDGSGFSEIRCYLCKGNFSPKSHLYAQGVMGMRAHLLESHNYPNEVTLIRTLQLCKVREVSINEVRRLFSLPASSNPISKTPFATAPAQSSQTGSSSPSSRENTPQDSISTESTSTPRPGKKLPPHILRRADGVYVELRCPYCGINASRPGMTPVFFGGLGGCNRHISGAHANSSKGPHHHGIEFFAWRTFTPEEIEALRESRHDAPALEYVFARRLSDRIEIISQPVTRPTETDTTSAHTSPRSIVDTENIDSDTDMTDTTQDESEDESSLSELERYMFADDEGAEEESDDASSDADTIVLPTAIEEDKRFESDDEDSDEDGMMDHDDGESEAGSSYGEPALKRSRKGGRQDQKRRRIG